MQPTNFERSVLAKSSEPESEVSTALSEFDREGYCIIENVVCHEELELLRTCASELIGTADKFFDLAKTTRLGMHVRDHFYVMFNPSNHFPSLYEINFSSLILNWVRRLLGPNAYLIHDQFSLKNPKNGTDDWGGFGWHQDRYSSNSQVDTHDPFITCLIPLDAMGPQNGGLRVVPFSSYPRSVTAMEHSSSGSITEMVEEHAIDIKCEIGDVMFYSSNLLHCSPPNCDEVNSRWVYFAQFSNAPLPIAERKDCAMWAGRFVGAKNPNPLMPLLHGIANPHDFEAKKPQMIRVKAVEPDRLTTQENINLSTTVLATARVFREGDITEGHARLTELLGLLGPDTVKLSQDQVLALKPFLNEALTCLKHKDYSSLADILEMKINPLIIPPQTDVASK